MSEFVIAKYPVISNPAYATGVQFQQLNYRTGGGSEFKAALGPLPAGNALAVNAPALAPQPEVQQASRVVVNLADQSPLALPYFSTPPNEPRESMSPAKVSLLAAACEAYQANAAPVQQARLISQFA